jgi:hypothetical protein
MRAFVPDIGNHAVYLAYDAAPRRFCFLLSHSFTPLA